MINSAASHLVLGCAESARVEVCRTTGLDVGMDNVAVGEGWVVETIAPWVDMAFKVSAAAV